jgi:hypothetical protein
MRARSPASLSSQRIKPSSLPRTSVASLFRPAMALPHPLRLVDARASDEFHAPHGGLLGRSFSPLRQHCEQRHGSILHLRKFGTISATCSTNRGEPKPPSNACAKAYRSCLTTSTQRSTWLCCCNEQIETSRRPIIGAAMSPLTVNRTGLPAHADH